MSSASGSTWNVSVFGRRLSRWHLLGFGLLSLAACGWHSLAPLLNWPSSESALKAIGWLTFPVGLVVGACVVAVSLVLVLRRRPDWRVLIALLVAIGGMVLAVVDLMGMLPRN